MELSRRDFVKASAAGAVAALLPAPLTAQLARARAEFTPLRRNVGIFTARGGTIGWLVNGDGVVIVDSQFPDTAGAMLTGLRERTPRTIDVLLNSHHHPDHTGGNLALREASRSIVAHARSAESQRISARDRNVEAEQAYPDTTFDDEWTSSFGDERVRARYYGPAHTGGDVAIFFEQANVVHVGDLVNNRGLGFIDGPAGASVLGWISVLEGIAADHDAETLYIFGHGIPEHGVTGSRADVLHQRDYFSAILDAARQAVRDGQPVEQLRTMETLRGFENHRGNQVQLGNALAIAYEEVAAGR